MSTSPTITSLISQFQDADGNLTIPQEKLHKAISLMILQQSNTEDVEKSKKCKAKKTKDPNAPKRAKNAYLRWLDVNRSQIKGSLGEDHKPTEVMKEAGKQWKALNASDKIPFEEAFKVDQERYKAEMVEYKSVTSDDSYSAEDYPKAPEGWSGPFQLKYLWKHAGPFGKVMRFKNFVEAIKEAATIEDCRGITKTSQGYELRKGPDLMSTTVEKENLGLASWVKGSQYEPVVMTPTKQCKVTEPEEKIEAVKIPKKKLVMKKVKVVNLESESDVLSGHSKEGISISNSDRKNVDYNFAELLVAVCLKCDNIENKNDIINNVETIKCLKKDEYIKDINYRNEKEINKYISFINKEKKKFGTIKDVYLLGKNTNCFPEITKLNQNLSQIQCKSDIMLKLLNNSWIGISVKATNNSFLTNYSVQKILANGKELEKVKREFLKSNGFTEFKKEDRKKINSLFYPGKSNIYWDVLYKSIEIEKEKVISSIREGLCSSNTPYKVYEVDGENVIDLDKLQEELYSKKIELIKKDYPNKKAAKMFYDILVDRVKKYSIEIRWKGNVFCSPQIMIQKFKTI